MQRAYGILDKYRISRTFFVKSDQMDCETLAPAVEADFTKEKSAAEDTIKNVVPIEEPVDTIVEEKPVVEAVVNDKIDNVKKVGEKV